MPVISQPELYRRTSREIAWDRRLVIEPQFEIPGDSMSAAASIDFHLGNRFTILHRRRDFEHNPLESEPPKDVARKDGMRRDVTTQELFVPFGDKFPLHPGHLVIGHTLEWFRFPFDIMAYVAGRSTWGRRGLLIAAAMAVQPGSAGTVALELSNLGEIPVALSPGACIGQLFFETVDPAVGLKAKVTSFSGVLRPILGRYSRSKTEEFLQRV